MLICLKGHGFFFYFGKGSAKPSLASMAMVLFCRIKELDYVTLDTTLKFSGVTDLDAGRGEKEVQGIKKSYSVFLIRGTTAQWEDLYCSWSLGYIMTRDKSPLGGKQVSLSSTNYKEPIFTSCNIFSYEPKEIKITSSVLRVATTISDYSNSRRKELVPFCVDFSYSNSRAFNALTLYLWDSALSLRPSSSPY